MFARYCFGLFTSYLPQKCITQALTHRKTTYTHSALWHLFVFVSLAVCQQHVSVGWGCEVVSGKPWPFLLLARTCTRTQSVRLCFAHPIPVVLRCYLSLTCQGCQVLMDGEQIGRRGQQKHRDINSASFGSLLLVCPSLHTQLLAGGRHRGPCLKSVSLGQFSRRKVAELFSVWLLFAPHSKV